MVVQSAVKSNSSKTTMASDKSAGPSEAMIELISPDGYYTFLGIPKPTAADIALTAGDVSSSFLPSKEDENKNGGIDEADIKKKFRKLSLKHHPDKGGNADTFRMLNRAQKVLKDPKLRKQYDILGLDLDDEEDAASLHTAGNDEDGEEAASQGIVHEVATMLMAALMHLGIKTAMMCAAVTIVVRYRITLVPATLFLLYVTYGVFQGSRLPDNHPNKRNMIEIGGPVALIFGCFCMYLGQERGSFFSKWIFWIGEATTMFMFILNSIQNSLPMGLPLLAGIAFVASLLSLIFRGKFWNYFIAMVFEGGLLLVVVMAFPVIEMMLETILNEKLRKVGDKVRAHQKQMEAYYASKK